MQTSAHYYRNEQRQEIERHREHKSSQDFQNNCFIYPPNTSLLRVTIILAPFYWMSPNILETRYMAPRTHLDNFPVLEDYSHVEKWVAGEFLLRLKVLCQISCVKIGACLGSLSPVSHLDAWQSLACCSHLGINHGSDLERVQQI